MTDLRRGIHAVTRTMAALARCESGQTVPEYALVTAFFGFAAMGALAVVASTSATQLAGTQGRVQSAAISVPTP